MPTPKDQERIAAFRSCVNAIGTVDDAAALLSIGRRAIARMRSTEPPPASLLEDCARWADEVGKAKLAARLFDAARPAEAAHA